MYDESTKCGKLSSSRSCQFSGHAVALLFLFWQSIETDFNSAESLRQSSFFYLGVELFFIFFFLVDFLFRLYSLTDKMVLFTKPGSGLLWNGILAVQLLLLVVAPRRPLFFTLLYCLQLTRFWGPFQTYTGGETRDWSDWSKPGEIVLAAIRCFLFILCLDYVFAITVRRIAYGWGIYEEMYFPRVSTTMVALLKLSIKDVMASSTEMDLEVYVVLFAHIVFYCLVVVTLALFIAKVVKIMRKGAAPVTTADSSVTKVQSPSSVTKMQSP